MGRGATSRDKVRDGSHLASINLGLPHESISAGSALYFSSWMGLVLRDETIEGTKEDVERALGCQDGRVRSGLGRKIAPWRIGPLFTDHFRMKKIEVDVYTEQAMWPVKTLEME